MTQPNKFKTLNGRFASLETGMTQPNKFENLNDQFASLGIGMTQPNKFKGWTLLIKLFCILKNVLKDFIKIFSTVVLFESSHHKKFNDELKFDLDKQFGTY